MRKTLTGLLCFLGLAVSSATMTSLTQADNHDPLRPDHPDSYVVKKGDTLWDISTTFLKTPWLWPEIWHANPQIANPHLIYPGDTISLVYIDGKPRLVVKQGPGSRTVKLTPTKRYTPLDSAIPAIPLDAINAFLNRTRVVERQVLNDAAYIVAGHEGRITLGKDDKVYSRDGLKGIADLYNVYGVFRPGELFVDPDTGEELGVEAQEIGMGRIIAKDDDIGTMNLSSTEEEVRLEDRLLPTEEANVIPTFFPSAPSQELEGSIIAVLGGVSQIGQYDVVAINKGEREQLEVGNIMAIYHQSGKARDRIRKELVQLPPERAGLLMIFKTFEKMSFALVLKAERPLAVADLVRNP